MKRLILLLSLALLPLMNGCSHNLFNVPQERFANQVKILGVAPIFVDGDSDIRYPQKDELVALLNMQNRLRERDLVRLIKNTNSFYTVTLLNGDPQKLFKELFYRRERRDDAGIRYNKYFWKTDELAKLINQNSLDALLLVVVSGITRPEKITSSNLMESLDTDYNHLIMTAQVLDRNGTILWEYPNFRTRILSFPALLNLQYPDFDEARANMTPKIEVKFKTMDGIKRALDKRRLDLLMRETGDAELYTNQFDEISSLITVDRDQKAGQKPNQEPPKERKP